MKLPRIPASVYSIIGRIPVSRADVLLDREGKPTDDLGEWDCKRRTIALRADLGHEASWQILYHEKVHMWLGDAGIDLPDQYVESVCDVIATALLAERMNGGV